MYLSGDGITHKPVSRINTVLFILQQLTLLAKCYLICLGVVLLFLWWWWWWGGGPSVIVHLMAYMVSVNDKMVNVCTACRISSCACGFSLARFGVLSTEKLSLANSVV